jgi:hypothetical protein
LARHKCSDEAWLFGADLKMQLLDLWFQTATQQTPQSSERELEVAIGAKGPKALQDTLQRLVAIGLARKTGAEYEPVPWNDLPEHLRDVRRALEIILPALRQSASLKPSDG